MELKFVNKKTCNSIFFLLICLTFISCTKTLVKEKLATETSVGIGSQTVDYYYIYSVDDIANLKSKYPDLGTIKNLYISSTADITIDIPKFKVITNLYIQKNGKVTINNVTTITKLSNGYSSYCTDINLPNLINIETINLYMDKTANFNFPNLKKAKKISIQGVDSSVSKDIHLDNIEEVTELLEVYGNNTNVYLENFKTGNLKFTYIKSLNGLTKTANLTGLEIYGTDIEELNNSSISSISGNLKIDSNYKLKLVNFSNLENIEGSIIINSNSELLSSSFESLMTLGKDIGDKGLQLQYNNKLTYLNLNKLESVQGDFEIQNTPLTEISFPTLTTVHKKLYLYNLDKATKFNFPILTDIGNDLEMSSNDSLLNVNFDSLKTIGNALIYKNNYNSTKNLELKFPLLEAISMGLEVSSDYALKTLEINKLTTTKYLKIKNNSYLDNISLIGLTNVDTIIDISSNKSTTTIYLNENLVVGQSKIIEGNIVEN